MQEMSWDHIREIVNAAIDGVNGRGSEFPNPQKVLKELEAQREIKTVQIRAINSAILQIKAKHKI